MQYKGGHRYIRTEIWYEKDQKVAVITGSSTGIGFETCLLFARSGIRTYATMRDLRKADLIKKMTDKEKLPLKVIQMDVDKDDSVVEAFQQICEDYDGEMGIDILVNNAGFGLFGALEDQSIEDIKKQFETNLFGAIRTMQQITSYNEKSKKWNYCKYFLDIRSDWISCIISICQYKVCVRRIK